MPTTPALTAAIQDASAKGVAFVTSKDKAFDVDLPPLEKAAITLALECSKYPDPAIGACITAGDQAHKAMMANVATLESNYDTWVSSMTKAAGLALAYQPPPPPIVVGEPSATIWKTDSKAIPGIKTTPAYIGPWSNSQMQALDAVMVPTDKMRGVWRGYNTGAVDPSTGHGGTLWFCRAFDVAGLFEDIESWDNGDFVKGAEGTVLYISVAPHKDLTVRRLKVRRNGAAAIQREFRLHETIMPESVWKSAVGTFLVEDCDWQETGLIDDEWAKTHPFDAIRASWGATLYGTGQKTIVRRVTHVNYWSPPKHEGSVFVGFGQSNFRTPYALVEDCMFWTHQGDRADIFYQGVDEGIVRRVALEGPDPYIDVVNDCKKFVLSEMPHDTLVRLKLPGAQMHGAPYQTYLVKKGLTLELNF